MAIDLVNGSRLRFSKLVTLDGVEHWDFYELPTIPEQDDDIQYQMAGAERIDLLANKFYGDPTLWWVIAVANDLELIPTDLEPGTRIRIPAPRYVTQELFRSVE